MAIDTQSVGYEAPPIEFDYTWRDAVVYALGVGASADEELDYLYEGRGPKVLPTFCTIPTFAAFDALVDRIGCDRRGMVHHSQQVDLFKPLRPNARLRVVGKVAGLYDMKRFAMSVFSIDAYDEDDELAIQGEVTLLLRNDGGFGGDRPPKTERVKPPERDPDFETRDRIGPTQALLYRLSGDYNPLHADPDLQGSFRNMIFTICTAHLNPRRRQVGAPSVRRHYCRKRRYSGSCYPPSRAPKRPVGCCGGSPRAMPTAVETLVPAWPTEKRS